MLIQMSVNPDKNLSAKHVRIKWRVLILLIFSQKPEGPSVSDLHIEILINNSLDGGVQKFTIESSDDIMLFNLSNII